jgi:hypothetical protein
LFALSDTNLLEGLVVRPNPAAISENFKDASAYHSNGEANEASGDKCLKGIEDERNAKQGNEKGIGRQGWTICPVGPVEGTYVDGAVFAAC